MATTFDMLSYARRMESVGFTRAQAEAMAEEQAKLIDERLASKTDVAAIQADIERVRLETKGDIEKLRLETKGDIEKLRLATKTDMAAIQSDVERLRLETKADIEALRLSTKVEIAGVQKDIEALRLSTAASIENLRLSMKADMELLRRDMLIRLGGVVVASVAAASTIVSLLSRLLLAHP